MENYVGNYIRNVTFNVNLTDIQVAKEKQASRRLLHSLSPNMEHSFVCLSKNDAGSFITRGMRTRHFHITLCIIF